MSGLSSGTRMRAFQRDDAKQWARDYDQEELVKRGAQELAMVSRCVIQQCIRGSCCRTYRASKRAAELGGSCAAFEGPLVSRTISGACHRRLNRSHAQLDTLGKYNLVFRRRQHLPIFISIHFFFYYHLLLFI